MIWKFELEYDGEVLEVEEPAGWDTVRFGLKRQQLQHGLLFEYSSELKFYKTGRAFIQRIFEQYNIDAEIVIRIYLRSDSGDFELFYTGVLLLNQIRIDRLFAVVRIEPSGFLRAFKATQDLDVTLPKTKEVILHSKTILKNAKAKINEFITGAAEFPDNPTLAVSWEWQNTELEGTLTTSSLDQNQSIFFSEKAGEYRLFGSQKLIISKGVDKPINLGIRVLVKTNAGSTTVLNEILYSVTNRAFTRFEDFDFPGVGSTRVWIWELDFSFDEMIEMLAFSNLYYTLYVNINDSYNQVGNIVQSSIGFDREGDSELNLSILSEGEPRACQGIMLKDAFREVIKENTGVDNAVVSDLLTTGCASNIFVTNGFALRGLSGKPLFANFEALWDATRKIFCAGIREQASSIVIEEAKDFYENTEILFCDGVSEPSRELAQDWYFNKIDVGYKQWQDTAVGQVNGLDEFNSTRQYSLGLTSLITRDEEKNRKLLSLQTDKVVGSGYLIEYSRRQFGKETTDFKFDNTLFFICLNREEVTSDKYTSDGSSATYAPLTVSERNERLTVLDNVIDPATVYNVALSPRRILERWRDFIAPCTIKNNAVLGQATFRSGEGNYLMESRGNLCANEGSLMIEDGLVPLSNALFDAEILSFEYPLSFAEFQMLRLNEGFIRCGIGEIEYEGFIVGLEYEPNKGIGKFTLLRKL